MGSIDDSHTQAAQTKPLPFNLTEVDRQVLALTDDEFVYHDWDELKDIIGRNDLGALRRAPSDLRRYIAWTDSIKSSFGGITNYICQRRLHWTTSSNPDIASIPWANATPFADASDYKILRNDWPYGLTPDIAHIVVWSKTPIAAKPDTGEATDESKALIEAFVDRTFVQRLQRDPVCEGMAKEEVRREKVLWFKNWTALQSVRSLEHFHVLLRGVPDDLITEWTDERRIVQELP
ncbi:hypothetical protein BGW36DRAFT_307258 [Talaromyces proteolyticus]|uniref:N-acetylglucosamine-induced protein 1 n=1 Tax=Talaromyces proteolyticus TaxID=1131652 RepID=A0AAD4KH05_9EURO|nr:uncharacterized protein BGW36DRAFT_307258 [Talaromyces proteolyticus]KAH8690172.1 hypothetical protein BGW36DRAFT_307258 [Talaromyces proteolyticus]